MADEQTDVGSIAVPALPPAPVLSMEAPQVEAPNPLMRVLGAIVAGGDPVGAAYHRRQYEAESQFWKQTEFAKYQMSHREDLSHGFDVMAKDFLSQQAALHQARLQLGTMSGMGAPKEILAPLQQNIADMTAALDFTRNELMSQRQGIDAIDASMGPMIAHMTPPPPRAAESGGGTQKSGRGATPYEMPGYASPSEPTGSEPSGPVTPDATREMPAQTAALSPPQHWQQMLESSGMGFPTGPERGGKIVNGRVVYHAETSEQAKNLQEQLKFVEDKLGGIQAPVDIIDDEKHQATAFENMKALASEVRQLQNKSSFYQGMEITQPKTAELLDMLKQATMMGDNERASDLRTIVNTREEDRKDVIRGMRQNYEDEAARPKRLMAELQPAVDAHIKSVLRASGVEIATPTTEQGGIKPVSTKDDVAAFGREFAASQAERVKAAGGDPSIWDYDRLSTQQKQMIVDRWRAARQRSQ